MKAFLLKLATLFLVIVGFVCCGPVYTLDDAVEAFKNDDYALAIGICNDILDHDPHNALAYQYRGAFCFHTFEAMLDDEYDDFDTLYDDFDTLYELGLDDCQHAIEYADADTGIIEDANYYIGYFRYLHAEDDYADYLKLAGEDGLELLAQLKNQEKENEFYEDENAFDEYSSQGSGFIIDPTGFIATNNHVIEDVEDIEVWFDWSGLRKSYKAIPVVTDAENDLAVLRITSKEFEQMDPIPYVIADEQSQTGTSVFTLGYPDIFHLGGEIKMTKGVISSLSGYKGDKREYQIDANIHGGNSGGPLFDENGVMIGINSASFTKDANIHYSIKSTLLLDLLHRNKLNMDLTYENQLDSLSLTDKIKIISPYVVLITNK